MFSVRSAIDLNRFRGMLAVAVLLILFLLGANFLLLTTAGFAPSGRFGREMPVPWEEMDEAFGQVAGLSEFYRRNPMEREKPFLMYLGLSGARQAVDSEVLRRETCHWRVTGLCGTGTGGGGLMQHLFEISRVFLRQDFHPRVVLLCIEPMFLLTVPDVTSGSFNPVDSLEHHNWRQALEQLSLWNWFSTNRRYISHITSAALVAARERVGVFGPRDPWAPLTPYDYPANRGEAFRQAQLSSIKGYGRFDAAKYRAYTGSDAAWLGRIITEFRNRGAEVFVVEMPEASAFRERVPAVAQQLLVNSLQKQFPANPPAILDFRNTLPEAMFSDNVHLNRDGRRKFSERLAGELHARYRGIGCAIESQ